MAYWLVETKDQLQELIDKDFKEVFIEPILFNDNFHPSLNDISLLYVKALYSDEKGYILCLHHEDGLSLDNTLINVLLKGYNRIYVRDRKQFLYFYPLKQTLDVNLNIYGYDEPTTNSHTYFYNQFPNNFDLNTIIPIVKHYEKCELVFNIVKDHFNIKNNEYRNKLTTVFYAIESSGITFNKDIFDEYHEIQNEMRNIKHNTIYSHYNLYTTTGRPSNSFNGINFAALNKNNGIRQSIIPKNNYLIEIDISAYHPTLAGQLISFDFGESTPYEYFSKEANIELSKAKILFIKQMYGGIYKEYQHIEYFKRLKQYINGMWAAFNNLGYVECPISETRFYKDKLNNMTPEKLFSYFIQNRESTNNVEILWDLMKLLYPLNTNLIMTTYDSFLLDVDDEESEVLEEIKKIFHKNKLKIKITKGKNYGKMISLN